MKLLELRCLDPRLYVNHSMRVNWARATIQDSANRGVINADTATKLSQQAEDPATSRHIQDVLITNFGALYASWASSIVLGTLGYQTGSNELMGLAVVQHFPLLPKINGGGLFRAAWLARRVLQDHLSKKQPAENLIPIRAETINVILSAISPIGHFSAPYRMHKSVPEMSSFFINYFSRKIAIPKNLAHEQLSPVYQHHLIAATS
jgi:hypothetical protein